MRGRRVAVVGVAALLVTLTGLLLGLSEPVAAEQQDPIPPPNQVVAPHELIEQLDDAVKKLADQQFLNEGRHQALANHLDQAKDGLMSGDPDAVLRPLSTFSNQVKAFVKARVLDIKQGQLLQGLTEQAVAGIQGALTLPFAKPGVNPCLETGPCQYLVLHVQPRSRTGGDGSAKRPFQRISQALAAAAAAPEAEAGACGVEIVLGTGTYRETVELDRATRIRGGGPERSVIEGSVLNFGGHPLDIRGVKFHNSPPPGAIVVDGPCGSPTFVADVDIRRATRHGIFQRGGSFRAVDVEVFATWSNASEPFSGAAIRLIEGVQAAIGFATLTFNEFGGLSIAGATTRVYLGFADVSHNEINPNFATPPHVSNFGAGIDVATGALLLAEYSTLIGNRFVGLRIRHGARTHFRYGRIEQTRQVLRLGPSVFNGNNVAAAAGGTVELSYSGSHHAFAGIVLLDGYARLQGGLVSHNQVGAFLPSLPGDLPPPIALACLGASTIYQFNTQPFAGIPLPVPCGRPPCPVCTVSVPFVCTWCTGSP